jgi:hypothetical protein
MLKQFKIITLFPTCFGSRRNHHQGAVLSLAKTAKYGFPVLVSIDAVNVMAAYQPVVQSSFSNHPSALILLHSFFANHPSAIIIQ